LARGNDGQKHYAEEKYPFHKRVLRKYSRKIADLMGKSKIAGFLWVHWENSPYKIPFSNMLLRILQHTLYENLSQIVIFTSKTMRLPLGHLAGIVQSFRKRIGKFEVFG